MARVGSIVDVVAVVAERWISPPPALDDEDVWRDDESCGRRLVRESGAAAFGASFCWGFFWVFDGGKLGETGMELRYALCHSQSSGGVMINAVVGGAPKVSSERTKVMGASQIIYEHLRKKQKSREKDRSRV